MRYVTNSKNRGTALMFVATLLGAGVSACNNEELPTRPTTRVFPYVVVTPKAGTLMVGETRQLTAEAFDGRGNRMQVPVRWSSADPEIVTVSSTGLVTGVGPGTGSVVARIDLGARTAAAFTVVEAGQ